MNGRFRPSPSDVRALKRGLGWGTLLGLFVFLPVVYVITGAVS